MLRTLWHLVLTTALTVVAACAAEPAAERERPAEEKASAPEISNDAKGTTMTEQTESPANKWDLPSGTYAVFNTSEGTFVAKLHTEKMPVTTKNFIELAEGEKEYKDPQSGAMTKGRLYDGRKVFRVIKGFMFQTGAANDSAAYDSGFTIPDEFHPALHYDKPGLLAMANAGPNTGSTQFFVTFSGPGCRHLEGKHPIFGEVVEGLDVLRKIENVPVTRSPHGEPSMPVEPVTIEKLDILRVD